MIKYLILLFLLLLFELVYFRIADHFNIIDKPNERSSHSTIVLRGGGIVFLAGVWLWYAFFGQNYGLFLAAVTIAAGVSFIDDICSLPDSVRLIAQFLAMGLLIWQLFACGNDSSFISSAIWELKIIFVLLAMVVCVGATNIYNFMDGINGITAGYSFAVMLPLVLVNYSAPFISESFLIVMLLAILVFGFYNFRGKGKAKCFAGDVGSVGMAFILIFAIGMLIVKSGDVTWLILLLVYGVDGCLTICHRMMLHENLGEAHRKHAYQIMANELSMSHPLVSLIYSALQLVVSFGYIYGSPYVAVITGWEIMTCHCVYLLVVVIMLAIIYIFFMKKYYHLHEEYLYSIRKTNS